MLNIKNTLLIDPGVGNADFLKIEHEATEMTHSSLFSSCQECLWEKCQVKKMKMH